MTNLTCFWHPQMGYQDRELSDPCPACGREMRYPLTHPPSVVEGSRTFRVVEAIDRGFYSATYLATQGLFDKQVCLKVIPRRIYEMSGTKNFAEECATHHLVAQGTQHLVDIDDAFDADVYFDGETEPVPCHVAVLEFVPGVSLKDLLASHDPISARTTAQIAIDLLRLLQELDHKQQFHNDLHAGNVRVTTLDPSSERSDAIDPATRAVAVDLGSVRDRSRSHEDTQTADSHQVTSHLMRLALRVTPDPALAGDTDFRLAVALNEIANLLKPDNASQRPPSYEDLVALIYAAFYAATSPWKAPAEGLRRFGDSFNAQTMRAWFVPKLLVDPGRRWQTRIESAGPLIVTGMRGCGKTMLLRALQFHARASLADDGSTSPAEVAHSLRGDGYVGLYVSCNRLLDGLGKPETAIHEPYTRLFLCYAREALQALRHLGEVAGRDTVNPASPRPITEAVSSLVSNSGLIGSESSLALERQLHTMLRSLENGNSEHQLTANPTIAIPQLATAVTACSDVWSDSRVLFLLDDVSTRHLREEDIQNLISTLLFPNDVCAFKITTEAQTLELVLKSPGLVEKARAGRDYDSFDLASEIHLKLREDKGARGREFVADVLQHRANLLASHPPYTPQELMGDQPLIDISRRIVASSDSSPDRKNVYWGMSALASVCVGDIGDVISIYEMILDRAGRVTETPIAQRHQSSAFQDYCSRRLYHLNRRKGRLKDFSDGFAKAAHDLLIQSSKGDNPRLRDYSSVYVRVTAGDSDRQLEQLRELMDAGVFVLTNGPDVPRTKTRDSNPVTQYILTYRKLLGLTNFIGLSQRDRFELSGESLADWLDNPKQGAEILMRNHSSSGRRLTSTASDTIKSGRTGSAVQVQAGPTGGSQQEPGGTGGTGDTGGRDSYPPRRSKDTTGLGETLFETLSPPEQRTKTSGRSTGALTVATVSEIGLGDLRERSLHTLVSAHGFEDRALESTRRILAAASPSHAAIVKYPLAGHGPEIGLLLKASSTTIDTVQAGQPLVLPPATASGIGLVDITGLSKPYIYAAIRELLLRDGQVLVAHTEATAHYPLNEDVRARLEGANDDYSRLQACQDILTGEVQPYHFEKLHQGEVDDGRRRLLFASSSAKHERLFSLLEERDSDHVEILIPPAGPARNELARLAGQVAARDYHSCELTTVASNDIEGALRRLLIAYERYYTEENYNVEVGLTGSKLHAAAVAAASADLKFAQAWYVRPDAFDEYRFTTGVGETSLYLLDRSSLQEPVDFSFPE